MDDESSGQSAALAWMGKVNKHLCLFIISSCCLKRRSNKVYPRFDIEENGMSCAPAWKHPDDLSYNLFLFTVGFFLPLSIILGTGVKILVIIKKVEWRLERFTEFRFEDHIVSAHEPAHDGRSQNPG